AARVAESLSLRQVRFASSEFLSEQLVFRHVHGSADDSLQRAILNYGGTHTANVPEFTVWLHNSLDDITTQSFRHHLLDERSHKLAILGMDACQVLLKAGCFFLRIKTVYLKKFTRPVAEETRGRESPATHVGKPLAFGQIILVTLEVFLGALAILDVSHDTIPLGD